MFKGPLGSHQNYIRHIALDNVVDYSQICTLNKEQGNDKTPNKYDEFRYFLNAMESLNNILEYYYFENEDDLPYEKFQGFKTAVFSRFPILREVEGIANAYKHCVRENRGAKQTDKLWAKDLQKTELTVAITPSTGISVEYEFEWPIQSHENILRDAFKFWMDYIEPSSEVDFTNL